MMPSFDLLLMAQPSQDQNPILTFLPLVLIFVVFYFFMIRPQQKRESERKKMIEAVKKGERVVTIGGIHGTVAQVDESSVLVEIDKGSSTKIRVDKSAIARIDVKE
ncbi:MAG: preprotein translocase subunit YajC [Rhodothermales bacterium]|nr:preprotein translocase subunit YajC [Rhodothermales bacterium]